MNFLLKALLKIIKDLISCLASKKEKEEVKSREEASIEPVRRRLPYEALLRGTLLGFGCPDSTLIKIMNSYDPLKEAEKWFRKRGRTQLVEEMRVVFDNLREKAGTEDEKWVREFAIKKLNSLIDEIEAKMSAALEENIQELRKKIMTLNVLHGEEIERFCRLAELDEKKKLALEIVEILKKGQPVENGLKLLKREVNNGSITGTRRKT